MAITIRGETVESGTFEWVRTEIATDADMSSIALQLGIAHGGDGPVLWLQSTLHGSEQVGGLALRDFLLDLEPTALDGTIIGVPVANPSAFANKQRLTGVDGRDANRSFPGSTDGYFSEMLANVLFETATDHADYFVDLHNGGNEYDVAGFCIYSRTENEVEAESLAMCRASDLPYAVGIDKEFGGSMGTEIVDEGIPTAVVEAGGKGHLNDAYYQDNLRAIENIAKSVDIVPGSPDLANELSVHESQTWLHAHSGGYFEPEISANTEVSEGRELARITDITGSTREVFEAPFDGVVVCMRSYPSARPGDWTIAITPAN